MGHAPEMATRRLSAEHRFVCMAIFSVIALVASFHSRMADAFAIYTVGADAACGFTDVQAAVNAALANPGEDYIWIANNKSYSHEEISVSDQDVIIEGGFTSCSDFTIGASDRTTLTGANGAGPIFAIDGTSNVVLNNVVLTGANRGADPEGGAIFFGGTGSLTISNITIVNNQAGYGAGIDVSPSGGPATLTLNSGSIIEDNTAQHSGGGIRIEGNTRMFMLQDNSTVTINTAVDSYGGGIEILGPARADIASPGIGTSGSAVAGNTAAYGGGIAVVATTNNAAVVRLFTVDATRPVTVSGNMASTEGGAFYLLPNATSGGAVAQMCLYNFLVDDNHSPDGAAIYGEESIDDVIEGSNIFFNPPEECGPESPASLGAVACAPGITCNELSDNSNVGSGNVIAAGPIIDNDSDFATLSANNFSMHGNVAARLITATDVYLTNNISTCLLSGNRVTDGLIVFSADDSPPSTATISNCTIANNTIDNGSVLEGYAQFTLKNSIIYQPGTSTLDYDNGACQGTNPRCLSVSYVLSDETLTLPSGAKVIAADPLFVNAADGDFHLQAYVQSGVITRSPAIDFAPAAGGNDLDGNPYDQDVDVLSNTFGPRDLGAYEMQPINDRIFGDALGDRLSLVY
jgi:hypothetical protein